MVEKVEEKIKTIYPNYINLTESPLYGLIFSLPMIAIYELGRRFFISEGSPRLTAESIFDVSAKQIAHILEEGWIAEIPIVAALLMIPVMLIWQAYCKYPWVIKGRYFIGMLFESLAYAFLLFLVPAFILQSSVGGRESLAGQLILSFGAGVYEEFLFRVLLVYLLLGIFRYGLKMKKNMSILGAIIISAVVFSLVHYNSPSDFQMYSFIFRSAAGVYFSALMALRGFGLAVGAHAFYDVFVCVYNYN